MSKADTVRNLALSLVGQHYSLGNEPWYDDSWEPHNPLASDCSGMIYGVFRKAGVLLNGKAFPRLTANDYHNIAAPISRPSKCGDVGFLLRSGHAYHVFLYVGNGRVVESGDGTGHVGERTVAHENARGAVWGRMDTDIGEPSKPPEEIDMTEEQFAAIRDMIKQLGYQNTFIARMAGHDYEGAAQVNSDWYWPNARGPMPKGTTVEQLRD